MTSAERTLQEEWRPIDGYSAYSISDRGRVRSAKRTTAKVLTPETHRTGYVRIRLTSDSGRRSWCDIHRLVSAAFLGPCPAGQQVRHLNGHKADNAVSNLCYGTASQNVRDQLAHGTHFEARRTHCPEGHAYDEANTWFEPGSRKRHCRRCRRTHQARYDARRLSAVS